MLREPIIHELKLAKIYFELAEKGIKNFELRFDDRDYLVSDTVILQEFDKKKLTGKSLPRRITYILRSFKGLQNGYVILQLEEVVK